MSQNGRAAADERSAGRDEAARRDVSRARTGPESEGDLPGAAVRAAAARGLTPAMTQRLQGAAGNRAVAGLVAQRRATAQRPPRPAPAAGPATQRPAGPAAAVTATNGPASASPAAGGPPAASLAAVAEGQLPPVQRLAGPAGDPKFAALKSDVRAKQKTLAAHKPATTEANAAQAAAKAPQDDKEAQGKAANAEKMNAAKPGEFDKAAFVKAVNDAIAAQAPKNLDEADNFGDSGKADAVKGQVQGQVTDGKKKSAGQIETATNAPPDTAAAKEKPVTPLAPGQAPATPAGPNPANAIPDKAPASATDFSEGPAQVDAQMADAQVTEEQLAASNEPEFQGALKEKKAGEQHAATAPGEVRGKEAQTLTAAKAQAGQAGNTAMTGMTGASKAALNAVTSGKQEAKGSDEAKRAQATAVLQKVFDATKKDVETILTGLDTKVDDTFSRGEKAARDAFTAEHKRRMDAYKDKRYSGLIGKGRWIKDKFAGLPEEANQIFVTARQGYVTRMQQVISSVADVIGAELGRAKQRIATGRTQLQAEVGKLPKDLQAVGKQAAAEFGGQFDELTESVNSKGTELVNTLASKYSEALKAVDAEIDAEKEKNKGLIAKAVDAVGGVIKTILQLKDLLLGVLAKAAQAVMAIIKDPIGFLGNLVSAVGAGLRNFMANIGEHLKKGLIGWLLGAMSGAGLQLPAKFDLRGILGMVASLLGLTWGAIRGRIVAKGIPEQAMGAVEAGVPIVAKLQSEGVAGITEEVKEQVGDLKENLFGKIAQYLIPTVLIAGITWIISLLNPASAFIKACKMIIDIVTFIIERGAQIIAFVNAVLDAVIAIAGGGAGGVPALIEKALALSVPVLIGALAAILGIGGIADKVKKFFQALSKPVMKAVDWVVGKIVKLGKSIWAKLKAKLGKSRDKAAKDTPGGKGDLPGGLNAAQKLLHHSGSVEQAEQGMPGIKRRYGLASMRLVVESKDEKFSYAHAEGTVQRTSTPTVPIPAVDAGGADGREKQVGAHLESHGAQFMAKVFPHWWAHQLEKTKLWPGTILDATHGTGAAKLRDSGFRQKVYKLFFEGKKTDPTKPGIWATVFGKGSQARNEFVETLGKDAEGHLRPNLDQYADQEQKPQFKGMTFDASEGTYGEFDPLPAGSKDANADLVKAVRSLGIVDFLRTIGGGGKVLTIDFATFKNLWDTDGNSKNWIKNQYRQADENKHEWIPTNYIAQVLEAAVAARADAVRGADLADDWVVLQHKLRSFTSHVVWALKVSGSQAVGPDSIEAHVGGFTSDAGNPMFNGKDGKWHKDLRGFFDEFVGGDVTRTPADFLRSLLAKLDAGELMWNGTPAGLSEAEGNLRVDATYKHVVVKGTSVSETVDTTYESGLTVARLSQIQQANFQRVRQDFLRALAALKVR